MDGVKINDLVDGDHPTFGKFRGVVTQLQDGGIQLHAAPDAEQARQADWIPAQIAFVAVLGYCSLLVVLAATLTPVRSNAIPLEA